MTSIHQMTCKILTSRKSIMYEVDYNAWRLRSYKSYIRDEGDDVDMHIARIMRMWRKLRDLRTEVIKHDRYMHLIQTLPKEWRVQAESIYFNRVVYDVQDLSPIIDYCSFSTILFQAWMFHDVPLDLKPKHFQLANDSQEDPEEDLESIVIGQI